MAEIIENKSRRVRIPPNVKNAVWNTYVSSKVSIGFCFCCNVEPISCANFECGRVQDKTDKSAKLQNLRPICRLCKTCIGTQNMGTFMDTYGLAKNANWYGTDGQYKVDKVDVLANMELENKKQQDIINKLQLQNDLLKKIKWVMEQSIYLEIGTKQMERDIKNLNKEIKNKCQ